VSIAKPWHFAVRLAQEQQEQDTRGQISPQVFGIGMRKAEVRLSKENPNGLSIPCDTRSNEHKRTNGADGADGPND
jgi:hypothetical protein